ncbi:hypothetical protein K8S19_08465 [bacterium]|nr:hypothetical protein [bacterium]
MTCRMKRLSILKIAFLIGGILSIAGSVQAASALMYNITVTFVGGGPPPTGVSVLEHFRESGNPHPGWFNVYNAQLVGDGTGKADLLYQPTDSATWGYATSNTFTDFDIEAMPHMRVVVTNVDASTGNEIWVNDGAGDRVQVSAGLGVGEHDVDVQSATGWTSPKSFFVELIVQSSTPGTGTRFDEIQFYNQNTNGMVDHFRLTGNPHPGWFNVYNVEMTGDGTGKVDLLYQPADSATWGYAASNTFTNFDIDTYAHMRVVITNVDASTGNEIWVNDGAGDRIQVASGLGVGAHNIDIDAITGWSSPKSFFIELIVQSSTPGTGTRFDEIKIGVQEY